MSATARLERFMCDNIPLAGATQMRFVDYDNQRLRINAPLSANGNHHGTAFGGSLYVVALAAGWGLTHLLVTEAGIDAAIYVQHAEADYYRPVTTDLQADAVVAGNDQQQRFLDALSQDGKARLAVGITIGDPHAPDFALKARFAARIPAR